jgi:hypothetical protein
MRNYCNGSKIDWEIFKDLHLVSISECGKVVCMRRYYVGEENRPRGLEGFLRFNMPEKEIQALIMSSLSMDVPLAIA